MIVALPGLFSYLFIFMCGVWFVITGSHLSFFWFLGKAMIVAFCEYLHLYAFIFLSAHNTRPFIELLCLVVPVWK